MKQVTSHKRQQPTRGKRWLFRLLAVLMGLSPFVVWESWLRLTDWRPTVPVGDPFVDFQSVQPLFVPSDDGQRMVTAANRLDYFRPDSFPVEKDAHTFRIFCLGGSTVQGRPFGIETSFTTWLKLSLAAADPDRQWQVVNCGGVSYASYRLRPILEEVLHYEPDLIILYTGHNEFLEDCSYATIKQTPEFVADAYGGLAQLRSLQQCHQFLVNMQHAAHDAHKPLLPTEVDALLDYRDGLAAYHRDAAWKRSVVKHFEFNLRAMVDSARSAQVPIILVDPPANLRDCAPFKSDGAEDVDLAALLHADRQHAIENLEQAVAKHPQSAALQYELGVQYAEAGQFHQAQEHLELAKEEDLCPLRIIESLREVIQKVAAAEACPLVGVRQRFEALSEGGIPGDNLFLDHVHPTIRGHQIIAEELMSQLQQMHVVHPQNDWTARRDELYLQYWDTLDVVYFEHGRQQLERLRRWTQGQSNKIHAAESDSEK